MAPHSDASTSNGLRGTLRTDLRMNEDGTWQARGLWDPLLRTKPFKFLELRVVTENIRLFSQNLQHGTKLKVWKDNQVVVHILNAMTSRFR